MISQFDADLAIVIPVGVGNLSLILQGQNALHARIEYFGVEGAHFNLGLGVMRHAVDHAATRNTANVEGQMLAVISQRGDLLNGMRHLHDGVSTFWMIGTGMGAFALSRYGVRRPAFACGDQLKDVVSAYSGLENQSS